MPKKLTSQEGIRTERKKPPGMQSPGARSGSVPAPRLFDWRTFDPAMIPDDGRYSFAQELTTYRNRLDELLEHAGEYVVIKGCEVIGYFPDRTSALCEAAKRFGQEPALVKQVVAKEPIEVLGNALL